MVSSVGLPNRQEPEPAEQLDPPVTLQDGGAQQPQEATPIEGPRYLTRKQTSGLNCLSGTPSIQSPSMPKLGWTLFTHGECIAGTAAVAQTPCSVLHRSHDAAGQKGIMCLLILP